MTSEVHDPETGEVIPVDPRDGHTLLRSEKQVMEALAWVEEQMAPWYRMRRTIRDFGTRRFKPAKMPKRISRTETQEKVVRCPRCGSQIANQEEYWAEMQELRRQLEEARRAADDS